VALIYKYNYIAIYLKISGSAVDIVQIRAHGTVIAFVFRAVSAKFMHQRAYE